MRKMSEQYLNNIYIQQNFLNSLNMFRDVYIVIQNIVRPVN